MRLNINDTFRTVQIEVEETHSNWNIYIHVCLCVFCSIWTGQKIDKNERKEDQKKNEVICINGITCSVLDARSNIAECSLNRISFENHNRRKICMSLETIIQQPCENPISTCIFLPFFFASKCLFVLLLSYDMPVDRIHLIMHTTLSDFFACIPKMAHIHGSEQPYEVRRIDDIAQTGKSSFVKVNTVESHQVKALESQQRCNL